MDPLACWKELLDGLHAQTFGDHWGADTAYFKAHQLGEWLAKGGAAPTGVPRGLAAAVCLIVLMTARVTD